MPFDYNKLEDILDSRGIKHGYIAGRIGVSRNMFARYVAGKSQPSFDNVIKLSDELGVSADEFYTV